MDRHQDIKMNDGKTHRNYPIRNKLKFSNSYEINVFISRKEYDKWITATTDTNLPWSEPIRESYSHYVDLCKFADEVLNVKIDEIDISYQELSDKVGCIVIKNDNLHCDFEKDVGYTDHQPSGYGGGSAQSVLFKQHGGNAIFPNENPNLRTWYHPKELTNNQIIQIYPPLDKKNYQFRTQMKKLSYRSREGPCMACFRNHGRIWMIKGTGNKAKCKTKGMYQKRKRDIYQ